MRGITSRKIIPIIRNPSARSFAIAASNPKARPPKIALFGAGGNMGRYALTRLSGYPVIAVDAMAANQIGASNTIFKQLNADNPEKVKTFLTEHKPDIVLSLVPYGDVAANIAQTCAANGTHFISTSFLSEKTIERDTNAAKRSGSFSSWENGLDPGIGDMFLYGMAKKHFKSIETASYSGSGIPVNQADEYVKTWGGFERAYAERDGIIIEGGNEVFVPSTEKFHDKISQVVLQDGTRLDKYVNGDGGTALKKRFASIGIDVSGLTDCGAYTLRHEGHCKFWDVCIRLLNILDKDNNLPAGITISPLNFLNLHIKDQLRKNPLFGQDPKVKPVVDLVRKII